MNLMTTIFAPDKILHLKAGALLALLLVAIVYVALHFGPGYAVAAGSIALGVGVEVYQKIRHEGTMELLDAMASAAVGVAVGIGYQAAVAIR